MSKHIQLSIADPCHENWENMTPVEKGKFCGSCQKQVIDFSNMSDREVAQFFKKPFSSVCGRFMQDQLDRSIEIPKKRIPWVKYFFQFVLPAFLVSLKTSAQKDRPLMLGKVSAVCARQLMGDTVVTPMKEPIIDITKITGKVVDEKGNPIPYATVLIKDTKIGNATDDLGIFSIKPKHKLNEMTLVVSSVGFETKEVNIRPRELEDLIIQLNTKQMLGEVVVISNNSRRMGMGAMAFCTSINQSKAVVTALFRTDSIKVYPNPVVSGSIVNIEVLKSGQGKTLVELYNMGGQKVHSVEINMDSKSWNAALPLPHLVPGTYIVKVYLDEKKKDYTTKIIVQ